jgi:hypothetical protein
MLRKCFTINYIIKPIYLFTYQLDVNGSIANNNAIIFSDNDNNGIKK